MDEEKLKSIRDEYLTRSDKVDYSLDLPEAETDVMLALWRGEGPRRTNAQAENSEKEGRLFVIKKLLPVLDTFDRAREMLDEVTMTTFNLIVRQFDKVLADCGVEVIDVLGQPFDPATANAVHSLETDKEEEKNVVLEVYANGYRYGDKVLRYAQVCVGV